jgi:hypothetical protein
MTVQIVPTESTKFSVGNLVATTNFMRRLESLGEDPQKLIGEAVARHVSGDWGECCPEDSHSNDEAVRIGERIHSIYRTKSGVKYWVITEWDRSVTTVLLPEDY